jgi:dTDP-4-amino-4,6-dideoxygalactose transaminase
MSWRDLSAGLKGAVLGSRETQRFAEELRSYFKRRHCFLVSSGKTALALILLALRELQPNRDRVLIPAFTCYSVPSAIARAGLEVSLCDIDPDTLDFAEQQLRNKLTDPRLLCVVPVHLFGLPADVARLRTMINDPGLFIVEDAAQAMGSRVGGTMLGTTGDVGFFSLGRGKALSAVEGGVVLTDRDDIGEVLARKYAELEEYGIRQTCVLFVYALALWMLIRPALFWLPRALPFLRLGETIYDPDFPMRKFSSLQAGLARHWRRNLAAFHAVRRTRVAAWRKSLKSMCKDDALPLLRYPLMLDSAEEARRVVRESNRQGLGIAPSYPEPVHRVPALAAEFSGQDFPAATEAARRLVTLPVHGYVREADRERVLRMLQEVRAEREEGETLGMVHG